jgi:hypothetical protein
MTNFVIGQKVIDIDSGIDGEVVAVLDPTHPEAIYGSVKIVTGANRRPSWMQPSELRALGH